MLHAARLTARSAVTAQEDMLQDQLAQCSHQQVSGFFKTCLEATLKDLPLHPACTVKGLKFLTAKLLARELGASVGNKLKKLKNAWLQLVQRVPAGQVADSMVCFFFCFFCFFPFFLLYLGD